MHRTEFGWIDAYRKRGALWFHDNNPKQPHAELTSGNHSSGFFNSRLVVDDDLLLREAASDLVETFKLISKQIANVDVVVGPQTGATKLAQFISDEVMSHTGVVCGAASPAKQNVNGVRSMVFNDDERKMLPGRRVLLCEDVLTTGGSVDRTAEAVVEAGGVLLPYVLVLVNRSGLKHMHHKGIIALIARPMPIWTREECPLCKIGSEAVRPKDNWTKLNASY